MAGQVNASPGVGITPAPSQVVLASNYITNFDFLDQYLPDTYAEEFERYGNRSVASFLRLVGSEYPTNSDMIKWSEQGRLHTKYTDCTVTGDDGLDTAVFTVGGGACTFRVNQTVFLSSNDSDLSAKAVISDVTGATFTVEYYEAAGQPTGFDAASGITAFVYGSEFAKGTAGMVGSLEAESEIFDNKPIIIKDKYEVSGSDMAQIGWIKVSTENGADGFYWFIKSEHETRLRFEDYLEMSMVEGVEAEATSGAAAFLQTAAGTSVADASGTQGMIDTIETRGNVWDGGNPDTLSEWDTMIDRLDKQGSIRENVLFLNRGFSNDMNDMIASQNSYGAGGTSYGLFNNSEDMAINLGFDGFKRGYEFYKTDWKYLNDATLRGGLVGGALNGVLVPAGSMTIYDQVLGQNAKRPFLHVRYRASEHTDRRFKTWVTGGAGDSQTNDIDKMTVNYLSERALCTMGANNFFVFKG
jgi:hypothetical protein